MLFLRREVRAAWSEEYSSGGEGGGGGDEVRAAWSEECSSGGEGGGGGDGSLLLEVGNWAKIAAVNDDLRSSFSSFIGVVQSSWLNFL